MEMIQTWPNVAEDDLPQVAEVVLTQLEQAAKDVVGAVVLGLAGDLGAGKTTFSQVVAKLLGVADTVTSPTFVIMKQYQTTHAAFATLVHIDAYRIEVEGELAVLGWEELVEAPNTLVLLEWPSQVPGLLPAKQYTLSFDITDTNRTITLSYGH